MAGLLDFEGLRSDPLRMGLLMAGLNMIGSRGNDGLQNMAQGFGKGLLSVEDYNDKRYERELKQQMLQRQLANDERQNRLTDAQLKNMDIDNSLSQQRLQQAQYKLEHPDLPNGVQEALWAAGGDENKARDLMGQWKQNPFQALNYQLALQNSQRADQTAQRTSNNDAERLDMERKRLAMAEETAKNAQLRDIPASQIDAALGDSTNLQKIDEAIKALEQNPNALGTQNYLPEFVTQRTDPAGIDARAKISDIAAQKRHDLSGAAVSVTEDARLRPFIPSATDTPEAAKQKLMNLRAEYQKIYDQRHQQFSNGYRGSLPGYGQNASPASSGGIKFLGFE